ncbi:MAG: DNA polymerase III subunit chi [Methylococcales bacterium]
MTESVFYILNSSQPRERYIVACKITEKAYKLGKRVFILTSTAEESQALDNLLWSFKQGSFIPHEIVDSTQQQTTEALPNSVLIGASTSVTSATVLINLSTELPDNMDRFERIVEIIDQDVQIKQAGRQRYKAYQSKNFQLKTHNL